MRQLVINSRVIEPGSPTYIIAEMSGNHNGDYSKAARIVEEAKRAGADALKVQTYRADTITIDCDNDYFRIKGTLWEGRTLYDLYEEAHTPWEWQPKLKEVAMNLGLDFFSTPFDSTAIDFLESIDVPAYKVASFELVDIPLLRKIAATGKPVIMSTGMASLAEIDEAVRTLRVSGTQEIALLKCTSSYPAPPDDMNLRTIPHLGQAFDVIPGLSDHSLGSEVAVAAVSLGACIVEKHITLSREIASADNAFSLEPVEFRKMVEAIRLTEKALGQVHYGTSEAEAVSSVFRRSLFVVKDMERDEVFTEQNVQSIRPGYGLHPRFLEHVLGRQSVTAIPKGTPLTWDLIGPRAS